MCQKNNRLVWDETVRIVYDLFDNVWGTQKTVEVDNITDLTVPVGPSSVVIAAVSATVCLLFLSFAYVRRSPC